MKKNQQSILKCKKCYSGTFRFIFHSDPKYLGRKVWHRLVKECRPRSDCSFKCSLIRICSVCHLNVLQHSTTTLFYDGFSCVQILGFIMHVCHDDSPYIVGEYKKSPVE